MQRLPVRLLEPGMRVARPVVSETGITLVNANAEITKQLIVRLENMHISSVLVHGAPVPLAEYMPRSLEDKLRDLDIGFSNAGDDENMRKLRVLLKAHFINKDQRIRDEEAAMNAAAMPNGDAKAPPHTIENETTTEQ